MSTIASWLVQNGLGKYAEQFESNDIDLDILPELTKDDLKERIAQKIQRQLRFRAELTMFSEGDLKIAYGATGKMKLIEMV